VAQEAAAAVAHAKEALDSVLTSWLSEHEDTYISRLRGQAAEKQVLTAQQTAEFLANRAQVMTRDSTAAGQGFKVAPHQAAIGEVVACRSPLTTSLDLAVIAENAAAHLDRAAGRQTASRDVRVPGTHVFIGHGRSALWRELKDFVQDRLSLPWDEFNRVPIAGITNIDRLVQMLDDAALALLVFTAEDEQADGEFHARANVIHEAGLFQGRIGFSRAIILLEEGCSEFSNIHGLGQLRFPAGKIGAVFEDLRQIFEREGLV
jgi:predicted nucleotide-binding protein